MWYVFGIFSSNPLVQLKLLSPPILLALGLGLVGMLRLRQQHKSFRAVIGHCILATLAAYAVFILMMLFLQPTATSYGAPIPVIITFGVLYILSLGAGLAGLALLFRLRWMRKGWRYAVGGYYFTQLTGLLLLGYAFYLEPHWLDTTTTTIREEKLPAGTAPIKLVLISDIHMERWTRREDETLARLTALDPDLLLISGDHINLDYYTPEAYSDLRRFFQGLHARYGVYASFGGLTSTTPPAKRLPVQRFACWTTRRKLLR